MLKVANSAALKRSPVVHLLRVGTLALLSSRFQPVHSFSILPSPSVSVFSVATPRSFTSQTCRAMSSSAADTSAAAKTVQDDPYIWLEDVESEASLAFAMEANKQCLEALGDPASGKTDTYAKVLKVLESNDRIPHVTKLGRDVEGNDILYNFWKDAANPKGLWRKTTLDSYHSATSTSPTDWTTVLNLDEQAERDGIGWVWKGSRPLPRSRDPESDNGRLVTRALLSLSRGGSDAAHTKEFDLLAGAFVTDQPFNLPEAKTRACYKSRDVLLVGSDFGPDSLTDSGYPRTVREWVRGTDIADAPVVFEGEKKDVSVGAYIVDERLWGGNIYEVRSRSMTFYTSKYWMRKIRYEHSLAPSDPARAGIAEPNDFVPVDIQEDAEVDFVGQLLLISLRSDWEPVPLKRTTFSSEARKLASTMFCLNLPRGQPTSITP
jgi:prolyl oligopeptidase